jgi:TATA-box binding protein (TBP) (component of TFIID and TFIIIB)
MTLGRSGHTAKLLKNGTVLIVGGWTGRDASRRTAEIYDPGTGKFTPTGSLVVERSGNTATLLLNGKVLVTGGVDRSENSLASAEIYDPETGAFSLTGTMSEPRGQHTATILKNGKVLVAGGGSGDYPSQTVYRSADLYDPATGKFTPTGQMTECRHKHAAILLPSGKVLIAGGADNRDWHGEYSSAELYDPAAGTFRATGPMSTSRFKLPEAVVLLKSGKVLIAGGGRFAEVYDETRSTFTPTHPYPRSVWGLTILCIRNTASQWRCLDHRWICGYRCWLVRYGRRLDLPALGGYSGPRSKAKGPQP